MDPGLYLRYSPMLEVFPYVGRFAGPLTCVNAESSCEGWFHGTMATMAMVGDCANLAENFSADPSAFGFGK